MKYLYLLSFLFTFVSCSDHTVKNVDYIAYKSADEIKIDGVADESVWKEAETYHIDQRWIGVPYTDEDFTGSFKLSWDKQFLYLLAEIRDDSLTDQYEGLDRYWNDDILEVFIDEDASGGNHQYNYNAFAYHIDKNLDVIDIGTDSAKYFYNDHIRVTYTQKDDRYTWEAAIKIFDDTFEIDSLNKPQPLLSGKQLGFALAYCDNDTSANRENFIGSEVVEGEDKNRGWIDAGVFGLLELRD